MTSLDPGPCCCPYGDFYDREGIMVPIHDCPAPAPLEDDLSAGGELTELERDLLGSLHRAFGVQRGTIRYLNR